MDCFLFRLFGQQEMDCSLFRLFGQQEMDCPLVFGFVLMFTDRAWIQASASMYSELQALGPFLNRNTLDLRLVILAEEIKRLTSAFYFLQGSKGNLTEEEAPLGLSLVITVGSVILSVYFLVWQTYVLKADVILNAVLLFTYGLESVLKVIAIAAFVS